MLVQGMEICRRPGDDGEKPEGRSTLQAMMDRLKKNVKQAYKSIDNKQRTGDSIVGVEEIQQVKGFCYLGQHDYN